MVKTCAFAVDFGDKKGRDKKNVKQNNILFPAEKNRLGNNFAETLFW